MNNEMFGHEGIQNIGFLAASVYCVVTVIVCLKKVCVVGLAQKYGEAGLVVVSV